MDIRSTGPSFTWLKRIFPGQPDKVQRREHLAISPEDVDPDKAKTALEQVMKRLDAQLAIKNSTETRALTLAGHCTTLLSVITGAVFVEAAGHHRMPLILAGIAAILCLFVAVLFAYYCASPRDKGIIPGRLPITLWRDFSDSDMNNAAFIGRLMIGAQNGMAQNEEYQNAKALALKWAIRIFCAATPITTIVFIAASFFYKMH